MLNKNGTRVSSALLNQPCFPTPNSLPIPKMNIKPDFDFEEYGIGVEDIKEEAESFAKKGEGSKIKNPFPVDAFPLPVQKIILATKESLNFPIDFTGASLLFAAGLAIGNTYQIEIKKTWRESPVLYLALVGRSGTTKSHPLSFAMQPMQEADHRSYKEYEQQKKEYDYAFSLSKNDREKEGISEPLKPVWKKNIVQDFTPEALIEVHRYNKRGLGVYCDELAGWFKNFNRYSNGSEEQFWLSSWSRKPITVDRKSGDPILITTPFIPVIGTIQNGVINELGGGDRGKNGFVDRMLFAIPDQLSIPGWSEIELNNSVVENWNSIITNLLEIPCKLNDTGNPDPETLEFSAEAKAIYIEWYNKNAALSNNAESESVAGLFTKLNQYVLRFALIIEMLRWSCGESDRQAVGAESINGAIKLAEYFRATALKVHSILSNPVELLDINKQILYLTLPDQFTTAEGLEIAENLGEAERSFKRFLKNKDLFSHLKRGEYEKRI